MGIVVNKAAVSAAIVDADLKILTSTPPITIDVLYINVICAPVVGDIVGQDEGLLEGRVGIDDGCPVGCNVGSLNG